eukprot:TRINITY_DN36085_c0_g1_i1.p1 TRINITY_DN36085_c0_g1~~TRINITY_DN36085_c0_g1_i1.p1  ORF type:complete len:180 (+),score=41.23 TRINITY_DN36085_c0_g1_i1:204-743(+)
MNAGKHSDLARPLPNSSDSHQDEIKSCQIRAKIPVKEKGNSLTGNASKQRVSPQDKKATASKPKEKSEKKVYTLPGQKHDPPEERDPLRMFYESLYRQIPNSEMATNWMMEHGLLPYEKAKKAFERKQKKQQQRTIAPIKCIVKDTNYADSKELPRSNKKKLSFVDKDEINSRHKRRPS